MWFLVVLSMFSDTRLVVSVLICAALSFILCFFYFWNMLKQHLCGARTSRIWESHLLERLIILQAETLKPNPAHNRGAHTLTGSAAGVAFFGTTPPGFCRNEIRRACNSSYGEICHRFLSVYTGAQSHYLMNYANCQWPNWDVLIILRGLIAWI